MKILYPHGAATEGEIEEILRFAIEGRKRVRTRSSASTPRWPRSSLATQTRPANGEPSRRSKKTSTRPTTTNRAPRQLSTSPPTLALRPQRRSRLQRLRNLRSLSRCSRAPRIPGEPARRLHETLLLPYLRGAADIRIVDPYIRLPHQGATWSTCSHWSRRPRTRPTDRGQARHQGGQGRVPATAPADAFQGTSRTVRPRSASSSPSSGTRPSHDRSITTDTGWKILLGRGLDIFKGFGQPVRHGCPPPRVPPGRGLRHYPSINVRCPSDTTDTSPGVTDSDATRWFWIGRLAADN